MSLTQGSQLGPPSPRQWSNPLVNRANPAGVEVLRVAGARAHLVGQVVGHGDAGNDARDDLGGRRSSGVDGFDATVHGRKSWWWLRAPGAALSTTASLASSHCGSGHDGSMADGEELSGAVETAAIEAKRARELGGKEEELTAESERGSASSGRT